MSAPLRFLRQVLEECLSVPNHLCVMGRGLGLDVLIGLLTRLHCSRTAHGVVFVLGLPKGEARELVASLSRERLVRPPCAIDTEPGAERAKMYSAGGVVFISARVLVVDLLRQLVAFHSVAGVLVCNAHNMEEHGSLALCLDLIRFHCPATTFIKGFTDNVEGLKDRSRCELVMRSLHASKLFLWPRFEARVAEELSQKQPEVVELCEPLSENMSRILVALQTLIVAVVKEICKLFPALDIPPPDMTNALKENWSTLIGSHFMGQWQSLGAKTKQLVSDLATLRRLATLLFQYDCVLYNRFLETIRLEKIGEHSAWMFTDAADVLFRCAKARVIVQGENEEVQAILEPCPKWNVLNEVLAEIREELKDQPPREGNVLLVCRDQTSALQVLGVLSKGARGWLEHQWCTSLQKRQYRSRSAPSVLGGGGSGKFKGKKKQRREKAEEKAVNKKKQGKTKAKAAAKPKTGTRASPPTRSIAELFKSASVATTTATVSSNSNNNDGSKVTKARSSNAALSFMLQKLKSTADGVQVFAMDSDISISSVLSVLKPTYVIVYESELTVLRALECAKNGSDGDEWLKRVYLMSYEDDVEDARNLESENLAFEQVINYKTSMVIEDDREHVHRQHPGHGERGLSSSRIGGAALSLEDVMPRPYVVVDTREFSGSKIPSKLWLSGYDVVPVTLEIGDYVLSDGIVVERKTVPDLISSFGDGRLFKQCQNMQKHYTTPILLIEFGGGPFGLQSATDLHEQVSHTSLLTKMSLLVMQFPGLRFFWSRDVSQTLAFFSALRKRDGTIHTGGPNMERIRESGVTALRALGSDDAVSDATARLFLTRMPGVNADNIIPLVEKCRTLRNLICNWKESEYAPIMGKLNASKFTKFIRRRYKADDGDKEEEEDDGEMMEQQEGIPRGAVADEDMREIEGKGRESPKRTGHNDADGDGGDDDAKQSESL